ncbi:TonB-dependent receptor [candidate division KSB1 bacterium]|nr:TonB-dependent receptor [candidate division KSB1 bacterium]
MRRKAMIVLTLILCGLLGLQGLWAGTTGKIAGIVTDASTGDPLAGTNVMVVGSNRGAAASFDGKYSILNLPPGIYTVRFTMMGYTTLIMENVRVSIDLTTTINADLSPTVLETDEAVTVVADRELIQPDMTSSMATIGADQIENLPVQSIGDVLALQAGVVRDGNDFHIRGGRGSEVAFWVDGVATTDVFSGGNAVTVENSAIQELQVVSGTFNAEYGDAMSGIVNIITKEGGAQYSGEFSSYIGDYISNHDVYSVLEGVDLVRNPETDAVIEEREAVTNPLMDFNPTYNTDFTLSGPIPGLSDKLTFFLNGRYFSNEGYLYGSDWHLPQGIAGDSSIVPMDPNRNYSGMGKLTYKLTQNMKLNYSYFISDWYKEHTYSHEHKYNPLGRPQQGGSNQTHMLALNHVLSPKTFYELRVSRMFKDYYQYLYEDPGLSPHWMVHVPADTVLNTPAYILDLENPDDRTEWEYLKQECLPYDYVANPNDPEGYVHTDSLSTPASYSYLRAGTRNSHDNRTAAFWLGKLDITSQVNSTHQVKAGIEVKRHELSLNNFDLQPKQVTGRDEQVVPYEPAVPTIEGIYHDQYDNRNPMQISAYLQDKLELKELIMNIGVRFDYFDPNYVVPVNPKDINIYDPFTDEFRYMNPNAPDSLRVEYTADERRAFMHKEADAKWQISPRLGIAYPISDRGTVHFSYGHFFQMPEFQHIYYSPDFKLNSGGGRSIIGNANIDAERTVQYEIGLQQALSKDIAMDVSLYYKDIRDWVDTSPLIETVRPGVAYVIYENKAYANVYGITVDLEKRFSNHFGANLYYMYQVVEGTYSNPDDAFQALNNEEEPRINLIPLGWDQRHTLNAVVTAGYAGWVTTLMWNYSSGQPYTPGYAIGTFVGGSTFTGLRENSARLPNTSSLDIRLQKRIHVNGLDMTVFSTVYNVFDQKGETSVYSETGTAKYSTNIDAQYAGYNPTRIGTYTDFVRQPNWYIPPRQVQIGLRIGF